METSQIIMVWMKIFLYVDIKYINNNSLFFIFSSAEISDTVVSYIQLDVLSYQCSRNLTG